MGDFIANGIGYVYLLLGFIYLFEGNGWKAVYFLAAAVLTVAVARM